jgi:hypothetical protein
MLQLIPMWQVDSHSDLFGTQSSVPCCIEFAGAFCEVTALAKVTVGSSDHASLLKYQKEEACCVDSQSNVASHYDRRYCLIYSTPSIVGKRVAYDVFPHAAPCPTGSILYPCSFTSFSFLGFKSIYDPGILVLLTLFLVSLFRRPPPCLGLTGVYPYI